MALITTTWFVCDRCGDRLQAEPNHNPIVARELPKGWCVIHREDLGMSRQLLSPAMKYLCEKCTGMFETFMQQIGDRS